MDLLRSPLVEIGDGVRNDFRAQTAEPGTGSLEAGAFQRRFAHAEVLRGVSGAQISLGHSPSFNCRKAPAGVPQCAATGG